MSLVTFIKRTQNGSVSIRVAQFFERKEAISKVRSHAATTGLPGEGNQISLSAEFAILGGGYRKRLTTSPPEVGTELDQNFRRDLVTTLKRLQLPFPSRLAEHGFEPLGHSKT